MFKNIKLLMVAAGFFLSNYIIGNDFVLNDSSVAREMSEDEILSWLDSLPVDLLERVSAGKANDNDLYILANLGKKSCCLSIVELEKILPIILMYLTKNRQLLTSEESYIL